MIARSLLGWLLLMGLAIGNGWLREAFLVSRLGPLTAHQVSTVSLCALIAAGAWATIPWIAPSSARAALGVGGLWLALTLAFELGFGHYAAGKPWSELFADYDLVAGRIWVLVPLATALAPWWAARSRDLF